MTLQRSFQGQIQNLFEHYTVIDDQLVEDIKTILKVKRRGLFRGKLSSFIVKFYGS